jgi:hypothetical protein
MKTKISQRVTFQGALELGAMVHGQWIHRQFMGYTKREALRMFKDLIEREDEKYEKRN